MDKITFHVSGVDELVDKIKKANQLVVELNELLLSISNISLVIEKV